MSSASVFNPHILAELRHIRSSTVDVRRNFAPSFSAISAVKRNIFGPVDHDECRILVEKNLEQQAVKDADFWGFDFVNELPVPGKERFIWEAIPEKPIARPQKRTHEPEYDISHLYAEPMDDVRSAKEEDQQNEKKTHIDKAKQSLITDFLKSKKKSSTDRIKAMQKMSVTPSPNRTGRISRTRRSIRS